MSKRISWTTEILDATARTAPLSSRSTLPDENFTGAPRNLKFTSFIVTSPLSKTNRPRTSSIGSSMMPPGSIRGCGDRLTSSRTFDSGSGVITMCVWSGETGATCTSAIDVAGTEGLIVGQVFRQAGGSAVLQLIAEGQFLGLQVDVDLERFVAVFQLGPAQLLDAPAGGDVRLAVLTVHVLEHPLVGVHLQPSGQVADRVRQPVPGDLAAASLKSISALISRVPRDGLWGRTSACGKPWRGP